MTYCGRCRWCSAVWLYRHQGGGEAGLHADRIGARGLGRNRVSERVRAVAAAIAGGTRCRAFRDVSGVLVVSVPKLTLP